MISFKSYFQVTSIKRSHGTNLASNMLHDPLSKDHYLEKVTKTQYWNCHIDKLPDLTYIRYKQVPLLSYIESSPDVPYIDKFPDLSHTDVS